MITSQQIEALDAEERSALMRRLAEMQLPPAGRYSSQRRFGRAVRAVVTVGAVVLVPWSVYLALSLPRRTMTDHWRGAWVGFDLLLASTLALTAWCAWHRRHLVVVGLAASSVLLACDAWFDVMLTRGGGRWISLAMALLVELPLAVLFAQAIASLERANAAIVWVLAGRTGPPPAVHRFPLVHLLVESGSAARVRAARQVPDDGGRR
ncbi:MAG: hypothetical protein JST64_09240 [Actinobacteria bacterium]|nr:hypothetical protein [Actinomycetota bacterium]